MNEDTFLSALHENPSDVVTWLALADWLEEDGQSERAEVVRLIHRLRAMPMTERPPHRIELEDRLGELMRAGVCPVVAQLTNSIGMRLSLIEPGVYVMGSLNGNGPPRDVPHVTLTRPFYMSACMVTQAQYQAVMETNPSFFREDGAGWSRVPDKSTENYPAESMTWFEAVEFCERLTQSENRHRSKQVYRLPTDAEWEYACRALSMGPFHSGKEVTPAHANYSGSGMSRSCPVASYVPNAFGLYDMDGNVCEWIHDWTGSQAFGHTTDPTGPASGTSRIYRSACFLDNESHCRSDFSNARSPSSRYNYLGFRVVLTWHNKARKRP